jgi:pimeloyl-ACP methyl ester carboxylesterase
MLERCQTERHRDPGELGTDDPHGEEASMSTPTAVIRARILVAPVLIHALVFVALMGLLAVPVQTISAQDATPEATPAPRFTETVDVDGRRLGLTCEGSGSPTIVLIGGSRSPADNVWPETVDALSPLARVCAFDRAGLGASDPQPHSPQTAADVVADLHAALEAAGETGPVVPVGWSFGGLVARLYASTYPDDLAGLVLVEGTPVGWNTMDIAIGWYASEEEREATRNTASGRDPIAPTSPLDQIVSEGQVVAAPHPPQVPTVAIIAGMIELEVPEDGTVSWSDIDSVATYYELQAGQARELGARIVIADQSGHLVPFDQPDVMIAAIEDVVEAVRDPSTWATPVATSAP